MIFAAHLSRSCSRVSMLPSHKCFCSRASSSRRADDERASPPPVTRTPAFSRDATLPHHSCIAVLPMRSTPRSRSSSALRPQGPAEASSTCRPRALLQRDAMFRNAQAIRNESRKPPKAHTQKKRQPTNAGQQPCPGPIKTPPTRARYLQLTKTPHTHHPAPSATKAPGPVLLIAGCAAFTARALIRYESLHRQPQDLKVGHHTSKHLGALCTWSMYV